MSEKQLHLQLYSQTFKLFPNKITAFNLLFFLGPVVFFWSWNKISLTLIAPTRMFHESIRHAFSNVLIIDFALG